MFNKFSSRKPAFLPYLEDVSYSLLSLLQFLLKHFVLVTSTFMVFCFAILLQIAVVCMCFLLAVLAILVTITYYDISFQSYTLQFILLVTFWKFLGNCTCVITCIIFSLSLVCPDTLDSLLNENDLLMKLVPQFSLG